MGAGKSRPLDTDPRCETLAPIWGPFVDAFVEERFHHQCVGVASTW